MPPQTAVQLDLITLPDTCRLSFSRPEGRASPAVTGLEISDGIDYEEWLGIGQKINRITGSLMFIVGDWLAYGIKNYMHSMWSGKVPTELYRRIAAETGLSESSLRNAKYVCSHMTAEARGGITFNHALEIVSRATPESYGEWIARVTNEGLSVKVLRETLKKSRATHKPEPMDQGMTTLLERVRQLRRDIGADRKKITPTLRDALRKELMAILAEI
ncbi:MAG: hypothetical protein LBK99_16480 [Opitutaceae bacterium]|jgi:hypothetical protein|nr:hypothetical protein [Opitutaceae bacterium]